MKNKLYDDPLGFCVRNIADIKTTYKCTFKSESEVKSQHIVSIRAAGLDSCMHLPSAGSLNNMARRPGALNFQGWSENKRHVRSSEARNYFP